VKKLIAMTFSLNGGKSRGVPQGSMLEPLLFLLYINNLTNLTNNDSKIILHADDTRLQTQISQKLIQLSMKISEALMNGFMTTYFR
jgi:hypothetical protein